MGRGLPASESDREAVFSELIDYIRFPLAVFVVAIHWTGGLQVGGYIASVYAPAEGCMPVVLDMFRTMTGCAVPLFFIISGYLFFRSKSGGAGMTPSLYTRKLKSRIRTLLIPYLLWNVIAILAAAVSTPAWCGAAPGQYASNLTSLISGQNWHLFWDVQESGGVRYPILVPLWYMRDLMVAVICAPLFQFVFKPLGGKYLSLSRTVLVFGALICLKACGYWPFANGAMYKAVLWFGAGAALALHQGAGHLVRWSAAGPPLFLCGISALFIMQCNGISGGVAHQLAMLGMVFGFLMTVCFFMQHTVWRIPRIFAQAGMFVYCWHDISLLGANSLLHRVLDKTHATEWLTSGQWAVFLRWLDFSDSWEPV